MAISNQKKIQHLYWRAGFGVAPKHLKKIFNVDVKAEALRLVNKAAKNPDLWTPARAPFENRKEFAALSKMDRKEISKMSRQKVKELNIQWIENMAQSENPLIEKMTLFWHDHFACRIKQGYLATKYINAIRKNALGNFKDLVIAISKDGAMLRYLNNQQNKKDAPNENYARELMELFTIGRGHYTETDIKEAARAFTGWSSDFKGDFVFRKIWHDYGDKTFMGTTGNFDGEDIINIILSEKQTAIHLTTKIYQYFVNERVNQNHINHLADLFYQSNYDIKALMKAIFTADWFYEKQNIGTKIKSPTDLLVGTMRTFKVDFEKPLTILYIQSILGQKLFDPPNVAGWNHGKGWIDNATLMFRINLVGYLFQNLDMNLKAKEELEALQNNRRIARLKATANPQLLVNSFRDYNKSELYQALTDFTLQPLVNINPDWMEEHIASTHQSDRIKTLALRLMSMPEYQLC